MYTTKSRGPTTESKLPVLDFQEHRFQTTKIRNTDLWPGYPVPFLVCIAYCKICKVLQNGYRSAHHASGLLWFSSWFSSDTMHNVAKCRLYMYGPVVKWDQWKRWCWDERAAQSWRPAGVGWVRGRPSSKRIPGYNPQKNLWRFQIPPGDFTAHIESGKVKFDALHRKKMTLRVGWDTIGSTSRLSWWLRLWRNKNNDTIRLRIV